MGTRLTEKSRVRKGDILHEMGGGGLLAQWEVVRTNAVMGTQKIALVRAGQRPMAGRPGREARDFHPGSGFHEVFANVAFAENRLDPRQFFELPDLDWEVLEGLNGRIYRAKTERGEYTITRRIVANCPQGWILYVRDTDLTHEDSKPFDTVEEAKGAAQTLDRA